MARAGRKSHLHVALTPAQEVELLAPLRTQKAPWGLARRAWAVYLIGHGQRFIDAARQVHMAERHVRKWVQRYLAGGFAGLQDAPRTGRPPVFSPGGRHPPGQDGLRGPGRPRGQPLALGL